MRIFWLVLSLTSLGMIITAVVAQQTTFDELRVQSLTIGDPERSGIVLSAVDGFTNIKLVGGEHVISVDNDFDSSMLGTFNHQSGLIIGDHVLPGADSPSIMLNTSNQSLFVTPAEFYMDTGIGSIYHSAHLGKFSLAGLNDASVVWSIP